MHIEYVVFDAGPHMHIAAWHSRRDFFDVLHRLAEYVELGLIGAKCYTDLVRYLNVMGITP